MTSTVQTFELALRATLAQYAAEAVPVSWIHCAMSPTDEDNREGVETYPQLLVQAGSKGRADNGSTWETAVTLTCVTLSEADADGTSLAGMFAAVEYVMDRLAARDDNEVQSFFISAVRQSIPTFCFGEFAPEASDGVMVTEGLRTIQLTGTLQYDY